MRKSPDAFMRKWRSVKGYEGLYRVSNDGLVESLPRTVKRSDGRVLKFKGKRLKGTPNWHGYPEVRLPGSRRGCAITIHTLVLTAFVGPRPEGMECRHLNGIRTDNRVENLAWGTLKENTADKALHGMTTKGRPSKTKGEKHGMAKFTDDEVTIIRKEFTGRRGWMVKEAKRRSVSVWTIRNIIHGRTYKNTGKKVHAD